MPRICKAPLLGQKTYRGSGLIVYQLDIGESEQMEVKILHGCVYRPMWRWQIYEENFALLCLRPRSMSD